MRIVAIALLCLMFCSCGTILGGGPWMVPVNSSPAGATVHYDGAVVGKTPCQVAMHGHNDELRLTLEGHYATDIEVESGSNWWGVLNGVFLIPGILIGGGIDLATGNYRKISTDQVYVSLSKVAPTPPATVMQKPTPSTDPNSVWGGNEPIIIGVTPGTRPWLPDDLNTPVLPQSPRPAPDQRP